MGSEKKISKRQAMREKRQRQAQLQRVGMISIIVVVALLVVFILIYPSLRPKSKVGERPMVNDNAMGDPNAPIKIEEFSDFQCPYCARFYEETEWQIANSYVADGTVYFVYRSFGNFISRNSGGRESQAAAEAAYCAGDQGKFWEYHDILFANQTGENAGAYADRRLQAFAEALSLDMDTFNSCFNSGKYADRVNQDGVDGQAAGVTGTPAFLITYTVNGEEKSRFIAGAYPFSEFQTQIEGALAEMGLD